MFGTFENLCTTCGSIDCHLPGCPDAEDIGLVLVCKALVCPQCGRAYMTMVPVGWVDDYEDWTSQLCDECSLIADEVERAEHAAGWYR